LLGEKGCGKHTVLNMLSEKLCLQVVDITKNLNFEYIMELQQKPEPYIYVISANELTVKSQNAMLKFIEEPLKNSFIVVLAESQNQLLPTVYNRCQILNFVPYSKDELFNFSTDELVLSIAKTPGQVKSLIDSGDMSGMIELANKMITKIGTANIPNILTISDKIAFKNEKDKFVKESLDFVLLEDFDHLYRFANLLEMDEGISAKRLVGGYTEITPGRPTIAEHRFATDDIKCHINNKKACPITKLNASIITAAEQQTMNYYMNIGQFYKNDLGRKLYSEIAMIEEQHVTEYGSLMDTNCTWLEGLLEHEYTECYLYYSCLMDETDTKIKKIWDRCLTQEIAHLHQAKKLLQEYEGKDYLEIIPDPEFPTLLTIGSNKEYIRQVLKNTVCNTGDMECHTKVDKLPASAPFFKYQNIVNKNVNNVASHIVINEYLTQNREDYRYEDKPNPVKELQNRQMDNTSIAR
jgi:DNA polymerase III delta prime subunit